MNYEYSKPNNCIYYEHGYCTRPSLRFYECPAIMCWNDDNSNNLLCDFEGYETKAKPVEEKMENKDWVNEVIYDDHPMGIPSDWDD